VIISRANSRHPDELFLLFLCLVSGITIVFGDVPPPDSIEAALPRWAAIAWGIGLLLGPLTTLIGIFWPQRFKQTDGLIVEQVGQMVTGVIAIFYGTILLIAAWPAAIVAGGITIAFGFARLWRWYQIQRILRDLHHEAVRHGA
jgi:hypothetical protein